MSEMSDTNVTVGMKLECVMKVSRPGGVPWLGRTGPVVIKLLLKKVVDTR